MVIIILNNLAVFEGVRVNLGNQLIEEVNLFRKGHETLGYCIIYVYVYRLAITLMLYV